VLSGKREKIVSEFGQTSCSNSSPTYVAKVAICLSVSGSGPSACVIQLVTCAGSAIA